MSHESQQPAAVPVTGDAAKRFDAVMIDAATVLIEFQSAGRLVPWPGPAVRGVVAGRFRKSHCFLSAAGQAGRRRLCRQTQRQGVRVVCRQLPRSM